MADQLTQLSSRAQQQLGFKPGTKFYSPAPFGGMNLSASRPMMDDTEFYWLENFFRIGDGKLRTGRDAGTALFSVTGGNIIISFFWYFINQTHYAIVFMGDGSAVQVQHSTGAVTTVSGAANTFTNSPTALPACVSWGSQYLIIANNHTPNAYFIWDGSILYKAGSISPVVTINSGGSGYASAPAVTAFGGSGSGITANAVVSGGSVVAVTITNPGTNYLPGETVQFAFSGGGSDTTPILTAVLTTGTIGHLNLLAGGTGFTPGTYALGFTGGGGTGAAGTYIVGAGGSVTSIALTNAGSGYTSTPTISFPSGGGTGAQAQAILNPGTVSSVTVTNGGSGFTSIPVQISFVGGGGTGAVASATIAGGAISSVSVTNGGSGYTSAPAVVVSAGANNAAYATASLMPFGVSGSSIETFSSRVWLPFPNRQGPAANGGMFLVSAPGSLVDFAPSDGGLVFTSTDRFLRSQYINLRQSNGYLYTMGDSSVSVISNVQTGGSPPTTTFNYNNVDPQIGPAWRDSVQDFSTTILFANSTGVYGVYGGRAVKISTKLDPLFLEAEFPSPVESGSGSGVTPSSAVAHVFNVPHYLILMTVTDPFTGQPRKVLACWNEKQWTIASQTPDLTYIGTHEFFSQLSAWGTDGKSLFPLMASASSALTKKLATKLYGGNDPFLIKDLLGMYLQATDKSSGAGISASVSFDVSGLAVQPADPNLKTVPSTELAPLFQNPSFMAPPPSWPVWGSGCGGVPFVSIGCTVTSKSPDFELSTVILSYYDDVGYQ